MRLLLGANVIYAFCLNVPEVALPLVLVTQLHASPVWVAIRVFVTNTVLVVAFQVPVTVWMSRFSRRGALAISGIVLSVSYLGFLGGLELGRRWAVPAVVGVSVLCTFGEIIYAGSSTALVAATAPERLIGRALARFQLSTGFGLAISPAIITALAAHGPAALWASRRRHAALRRGRHPLTMPVPGHPLGTTWEFPGSQAGALDRHGQVPGDGR